MDMEAWYSPTVDIMDMEACKASRKVRSWVYLTSLRSPWKASHAASNSRIDSFRGTSAAGMDG